MRAAGVAVLLASLIACTPSLYKRDVTVMVQGPSRIAVGESVLLTAVLSYSDGSMYSTQPSANEQVDWASSNPSVAAVVTIPGRERNAGLVTGVGTGDVTITATPNALTTGTGRRIPGTLRITVVDVVR